uniref:E3 ubiquitin-protein ligase PPP1R11 n=1 Tax=Salarias fasciatus TaxID=181472 RepID=A0A672H6U8_SALFA
MAEVPGTSSETITETVQTSTPPPPAQEGRSLTIKLRKRKTEKKVEWSSDTVDNEHLGRRSSKCCCVYEKPRQFGESSSESEGDEDDEGCGSAHCILGHGRRGAGQRGGGGRHGRHGPACGVRGQWTHPGVCDPFKGRFRRKTQD